MSINISKERIELLKDSIRRQIEAGIPTTAINSKLQDKGISSSDAHELIQIVESQLLQQPKNPSDINRPSIVKPVVAGLIAALVVGIIWAFILIITEHKHQYGYVFVAYITGYLSALGALEFSFRQSKWTILAISGFSSLVGFLFGKIVSYYVMASYQKYTSYFDKADIFWLIITVLAAILWSRRELLKRA